MNFNYYRNRIMQFIGTALIILGISVLVLGSLCGIGYEVYLLAITEQWVLAVVTSGLSLICVGYIVRFIFRNRISP